MAAGRRDLAECARLPGLGGREPFPFHVDHADVVLAAGGIRRIDQLLHNLVGPTRKTPDDVLQRRRVDEIGQPVAAEEQRGVRLERDLARVDEVRIVGLVRVGSDIAIHLVAPRVVHRLELGELAGVFALADRRVIARDLVDAIRGELVQARVADVAHHGARVVDNNDGEDARHPVPLRPQDGGTVDLVVRDRDCLAHAIDSGAGPAFESRPHRRERDVGGLSAGRLAADTVDDQEQSTRGSTWMRS